MNNKFKYTTTDNNLVEGFNNPSNFAEGTIYLVANIYSGDTGYAEFTMPATKIEANTFTDRVIPPFDPETTASTVVRCTLHTLEMPASILSIGENAFKNSDIATITFNGTKAQWNAIEKHPTWHDDCGSITVHCTDGDVVVA